MGFCSPVCKILRRAKYVVLLLISLSVLVWIRTFSGEVVKSFQVSYATTQTLVKGDSLKDKLNLWTVAPDHKHTQPPKAKCPQQSPLLRKYTLVEVKEVTNLQCVCYLDLTGFMIWVVYPFSQFYFSLYVLHLSFENLTA